MQNEPKVPLFARWKYMGEKERSIITQMMMAGDELRSALGKEFDVATVAMVFREKLGSTAAWCAIDFLEQEGFIVESNMNRWMFADDWEVEERRRREGRRLSALRQRRVGGGVNAY